MSSNIITPDGYYLEDYQPNEDLGDSGELFLSTNKADPGIQYIIKYAYSDLACNEFMYHKIAAALGMYTPEVKFIADIPDCETIGIRFIPNAVEFDYDNGNEAQKRDYYAFKTLYVILNEEDSEEYHIDGQGRLFKLDNAAAFNIQDLFILELYGKAPLNTFNSRLENTYYLYYGEILKALTDRHGQTAKEACLETFERFAEFDETVLEEAYDTLAMFYPQRLVEYFREFIRIRKAECRRFLCEMKEKSAL